MVVPTVTIPATMSSDGVQHIYTGNDDPITGITGGMHEFNLLPMFIDVVSVASYVVTTANSVAQNAANAAASAAAAAQQANTLTATSTTSMTIGTGSKTLAVQSGEQFIAGQFVTIADSVTPSNFMYGQVTSYSGTSLVVSVTAIGGSGTKASWTISLSGIQGATGAAGSVNSGAATNITGIVKGNGSTLSNAVAGTDYQIPLSAIIVSGNVTITSFTRCLVDTSAGVKTITLPAAPSVNDIVEFADYAGTWAINNATVASNALKIMGAVQDLILNVKNGSITLIYSGATMGWIKL